MSTLEHRVPAAELHSIMVHLDKGDVRIGRIEGDDVVVEGSEGISVERAGEQLRIGGGGRRVPEPARSIHKAMFGGEPGPQDPEIMGGPVPGDLGSYIGTVVTQAMGGLLRGDFFSGGSQGKVRIGIPALLEMPRIEARISMGDLSLEGLRGEIFLHSHMGDVKVANSGGTLEARSGKGDIEVQRFAGPVLVHTGAGDLELEHCTDGGSVNTGAGDVEGRGLHGAWELRTGSGDVKIDAEEGAAASFHVTTGSGDVEIRGGEADRLELRTGSGDLECATVLRGTSHRFSTGAGDIKLALANPPGARVQALTRMGSVSSEFPLVMVGKQGPHSGSGARYVGNIGDSAIDVELKTGYGDIEIVRLEPGRQARSPRPARASEFPAAVVMPPSPRVPPMPPTPSMVPPGPPAPPVPPTAPMVPDMPAGAPAPTFGDFPQETQMNLEKSSAPLDEQTPAARESREPVGAGAPSGMSGPESPRLKVLESLGRGEITVQEASTLLRSLSGQ